MTANNQPIQEGWQVEIYRLDADGANQVVAFAIDRLGLEADTVDPAEWLTMRLDPASVAILLAALERVPDGKEKESVDDFIYSFQRWISIKGSSS